MKAFGTRFLTLATATVLALIGILALGCGGSTAVGSGGTGTLAIHMSDGGGNNITDAKVTITRIDANIDGQWQTVSNTTQTVDLFDLRNNDTVLGSALVAAGSYTQVRLIVSSATVTDSNGTHDVKIPSGIHTGIKLNLDFTVDPNVITAILLDFNVGQSFVLEGNGQYLLQPVIPIVVQILSGTATGTVTDASGVVSGASIAAVYDSGGNYPPGTQVNTTTSQADGTFKMWALKAGTYHFDFTYTNANNVVETATVSDVTITANQDTALGTILLQ